MSGAPVALSATRRQARELVDGTIEVKLHIDPRFKADFHRLFPDIDMPVAIAPLEAGFESAHSGQAGQRQPNEIARAMHSGGYFRNQALWAAVERHRIYTQAEHKKFIESLSCCLADFSPGDGIPNACNGDVVGHHVRTAANSGTGIKPPDWYLIPVCHTHHDAVHRMASREQRNEQLVLAVDITAAQVKAALKRWLGIQSLREITPEQKADIDSLMS